MMHTINRGSDDACLTWLSNFVEVAATFPSRYGMNAGDLANLTARVGEFRDRVSAARNPLTRNAPAVARKCVARNVAVNLCRVLAAQVRANMGVSIEDKIALGLPPAASRHRVVSPPNRPPTLAVFGQASGLITVTAYDAADSRRRARPTGAAGLELWLTIADAPATHPHTPAACRNVAEGDVNVAGGDVARYYGFFTRPNFVVEPGPWNGGKVVTFFARWRSRRAEYSPWSGGVSVRAA